MSRKAKPGALNIRQPAYRSPAVARPQLETLAESRLRAASVRVTAARVGVLAALMSAGRALSHQDVQDSFAGMDRVTLYRALDCLIEAGLAHRIAGDDRVFRYSTGAEHASGDTGREASKHPHGHFKCTRCARVFCLDGIGGAGILDSALQQSLGQGFRSHDIEFTIKGWCADCAH